MICVLKNMLAAQVEGAKGIHRDSWKADLVDLVSGRGSGWIQDIF